MADSTIGIKVTADARSAIQVIKDLVAALGLLGKAEKDALKARQEAGTARGQALSALNAQLAVAKQNVIEAQREAANLQKINAQKVADAEATSRRLQDVASQTAAANNRTAQQAAASAQQEATSVRAAAESVIRTQQALVSEIAFFARERIIKEQEFNAFADRNAARNIARVEAALAALRKQRSEEQDINKQRIRDAKDAVKAAKDAAAAPTITKDKATGRFRDVSTGRLVSQAAAEQEQKQNQQRIKDRQADLEAVRRQAQVEDDAAKRRVTRQAEIVATEKKFSAEQAKDRAEALAKVEATGKKEVAVAKATADGVIAAENAKVTAKDKEATAATKNVDKVAKAGEKEVTAAKKTGDATVAAAKRAETADNKRIAKVATNAEKRVSAVQREIKAVEDAAAREKRAVEKANAAKQAQDKINQKLDSGLKRLRTTILQLVSAYAGLRVLGGLVNIGLKFDQTIESAKLGIAALITAQAQLFDSQGKLLTGTAALGAAQVLAKDQLDKLRVAGIQTTATTEELVTAFQEAVGAGVSVGLTLDQIRLFSVSVAQAATAINLPMNQLQQETRSILQGTIDRNSRLAKSLNITNAMVNQAKAEGKLFDLLNQKFAAFNIAGAESVKTWAALKTTIQDAFSVFAGTAVQPLFEQLRKAGFEAINRIFDFKSADIQENFRGLIETLREIFQQVGQIFSVAIKTAVQRAESLSKWLRENRETVQKTAGALSTMVREFGLMIVAIGQGIAEMLSFGGQVNTVVGVARTLSAIFQTIAENIKLIVGLLTARALVVALVNIGTAIAGVAGLFGIGATAAAGATIGSIVPVIGTAIGSLVGLVVGLGVAYKVLKGDMQAAKLEAARVGNAFHQQQTRGIDLLGTLLRLDEEIKAAKKANQDTTDAEIQRQKTEEELRKLGPEYARIIDDGTLSLEERRKKLIELARAQQIFAAHEFDQATKEVARLRKAKEDLQAAGPAKTKTLVDVSRTEVPHLVELEKVDEKGFAAKMKVIDDAMQVATDRAAAFESQARDLTLSLDQVTAKRATVKPITPAEVEEGESPEIKQARARFEEMKAQLEVQRTQLDLQLQTREKTVIQHINQMKAIDLAEVKAEKEFIEAQIKEEERKRRKAAATPGKEGIAAAQAATDAIRGFQIQQGALALKEEKIIADANAKLLENEKDTTKARLEIQANFLEATGKLYDAARLRLQIKQEEDLRKAVQDFAPERTRTAVAKIPFGNIEAVRQQIMDLGKDMPPILWQAIVVVDHAAVKEELDLIEEEIKRAQEQMNREQEAIRARFSKRKLSDAEKQQFQNELSAAATRAEVRLKGLREQLLELQKTVKDPAMLQFIQLLLAMLDAVTAKTKAVNIELQNLINGAREAFERGFAEFFQSIGSGAEKGKNAFHEMALSIINDMRRIIAELIAKRLTESLFKFLGIVGGAQKGGKAGNVTQSGGRAEGGLARPPHGVLHGGTPGRDSIPIAAMPEEYFTRREAVRLYGSDIFDLFNQMRVPVEWARELRLLMRTHMAPPVLRARPRFHYASGGAVSRSGSSARPSMSQTEHTITVDADGLLRFLTSNKGKDITLSHVGSSPRFVHTAIQKRLKLT